MIWELLLKTFIPVSRIFDNEDDIFQECSKIQRQRNLFKKQNQKYYEILTIYECVEK